MKQQPTINRPTNTPATPTGDRYALPTDLASHRIKLAGIAHSVTQFEKTMDGYFFGVVGADGLVSMVPYVGDVLSGLTTFWLLMKAGEVKMSLGDRAMIAGLGILDVAMGFFPIVGDAADFFFRAHAWNGSRICQHIEVQIQQINAVEQQLIKSVPVAQHRETLDHLRDSVFRGGKTKKDLWVRFGIIAAACVVLLGYCAHEATLRNERLIACQSSGGWFCEWRY